MVAINTVPHCPLCGTKLERTFKFVPYGRAHANVHVCMRCNEIVLSWRLLISHPRENRRRTLVIPTNTFLHRDFIERARVALSPDGGQLFNEERIFTMTDKEFRAAKERTEASEYGVVIGAYYCLTKN